MCRLLTRLWVYTEHRYFQSEASMARFFLGTLLIVMTSLLTLAACDNSVDFPTDADLVFSDDSSARYFGKMVLADETPKQLSDGTEVYTFRSDLPAERLPLSASPGDESIPTIGRGPACLYGDSYRVLVQRGAEGQSNNLVIETDGDGACFVDAPEAADCFAPRETATSIWPTSALNTFLSPDPSRNPFTSDWNRIYLPYCDYSLFAGDTNAGPTGSDSRQRPRYYRGTQNFTAGLQIAKRLNPNPDKILISGAIAGGYGAVINTPSVAAVFPDSDIYVFSDSGALIAVRDGDAGFLETAMNDYNASYYIPESCGDDCLSRGTLVTAAISFVGESSERQGIRLALATTTENRIVGSVFLQYDDIADFAALLIEEVTRAEASFAGPQLGAFLIPGSLGTLSDVAREQGASSKFDIILDGVRLGDWIDGFLNDDPDWDTIGVE